MVAIREQANKPFLRQPLGEDGLPLPYKKYVGGSNYSIEIVANAKGKWEGEVITRFQAYQIVAQVDKEFGKGAGVKRLRHKTLSQSNQPLIMRLCIDDTVMMTIDEDEQLYRFVSVGSTSKQMFFAPIHEANVNARNIDKADPFIYVTKLAGSFQKTNARKVIISPLGIIRKK